MKILLKNFYKISLLLVLFLACVPALAQKKFTIVLDAGHGGQDAGATKYYGELGTLREKDITLDITLAVGRMLEKNKEYKVIYTRKVDEYPSLTERTNLANRSKADLFVSIHVNSAGNTSAHGTETFVQGPNQNKMNLEVAKAENAVIWLDEKDKETFGSYDASSPESLIALRIQQEKYLQKSLLMGGFVEDNFSKKDGRFSRGVKQQNLHVLRLNAMPSVLIEIGFVSNFGDAQYISSAAGQKAISQSIYDAVESYRAVIDRRGGRMASAPAEPEKPKEQPLKSNFRILLMSSPVKYNIGDPALKGLSDILTIKENGNYFYYFASTNFASTRDANFKIAKDAGFRNASITSFMPNQALTNGYYTIELAASKEKLADSSLIMRNLKNVQRNKVRGTFYYTYGQVRTLEEAIKLQQELAAMGINYTAIQKVTK